MEELTKGEKICK